MKELLKDTSERLLYVIAEAMEKFATLSENDWSVKQAPEKWSRKEILGHLIDSAANNHLRFVRAQLAEDTFTGKGYEQDLFVTSQKYAEANTEELILLWHSYNQHLATVIRHINPGKLDIACHIGCNKPVPFSFIITDYVSHLEHHIKEL